MARHAKCPTCGERMETGPCASCGAEPPAAPADRDEGAEIRDRAARARDREAEARDASARRGEVADVERARMASGQDQVRSDHDEASSRSDQRSADHDQRTADSELAAGGDPARHRQGIAERERSRGERSAVSASRDETSAVRLHDDHRVDLGAYDRRKAAEDREGAAGDRQESARDRADAVRQRLESAGAARRALETLESMSDAFFTLGPDWRFTYLNPQCDAVLERRREDLLGRNIWEEFPEAADSRFGVEYRRAISEQASVRFEARYEPLHRTFEVRAHPVPDGLAVYFTDVTEERVREARFRQVDRLEMLGQLTAGVVHDFNNLLAAVGGFAKLGQRAAVDEKTTGYFDQIDAASEKAVALSRHLLGFARAHEPVPTTINANDAVDGLSSLLRQLMPVGIDLQLALSPEPVYVFLDPTHFEQVVLNLIVNGRDAIEPPGTITVGTANDAPAGLVHDVRVASGWLQVTDTGSGIPEDVKPHIFDPFFSTKPPGTGTGLGLATIAGIVARSGGSIFVESTDGAGTTMTVAFPAGPTPR